ncbi:MAG: hypothetical protein WC526_04300 [Patescibacteria group bacterium]
MPDKKVQPEIWLWTGVIIFAIIIVGLWGWAIKIKFSSINWAQTPEAQMVGTQQKDWNQIFADEKDKIILEDAKNKLKTIINDVISSASSTPTTTVNTSTKQ